MKTSENTQTENAKGKKVKKNKNKKPASKSCETIANGIREITGILGENKNSRNTRKIMAKLFQIN